MVFTRPHLIIRSVHPQTQEKKNRERMCKRQLGQIFQIFLVTLDGWREVGWNHGDSSRFLLSPAKSPSPLLLLAISRRAVRGDISVVNDWRNMFGSSSAAGCCWEVDFPGESVLSKAMDDLSNV